MEKKTMQCDMSLADFTTALAEEKPAPGSGGACALCGALAAALGAMSCAVAAGADEAASRSAQDTLLATRGYFIKLVDEDAKALIPLQKYVLDRACGDPKRAENEEACLRVACGVPTEVLYTGARVVELLSPLAGSVAPDTVCELGCAIELALGAMRAARLRINGYAAHIADDVFASTLRRECELVFERYQPMADEALKTVFSRL